MFLKTVYSNSISQDICFWPESTHVSYNRVFHSHPPRPFPPAFRLRLHAFPFPGIQHEAEHVEAELRILQTQCPEIVFRLVPQHVAALAPKGRDRFADRGVCVGRICVHETRVGELAAGGRVDPVNFGVREGFELLIALFSVRLSRKSGTE